MKRFKEFLLLTAGSVMIAAGVYFFKLPNHFSTGGVSGIATVLDGIVRLFVKGGIEWLTPGLIVLVLNVLLLVVGFIFVNKEFGIKTVYCTLVYSLLTYVFQFIVKLDAPVSDQPLLELVYAILLTSIGSALLFNADASSGGTDIIAMILKKYTSINVGMALLIADSLVAFSSFFVFDVTTGLFSVLGLFAKSFLVDNTIENINLCKYFTIITEKSDEICDYIMNELHRGVTKCDAEGAFSHRQKAVLLTVCHRFEGHRLKSKIKEIDPSAFIMITNSSEIFGRGFRNLPH